MPVSRRPTFAETARVMAVAAPVLEQLTLAVAGFVVFVTGMIAVAAHHEAATLSYRCRNNKPPGFPGGLLVFLITYPSSSRREQLDTAGSAQGPSDYCRPRGTPGGSCR